MPKVSLQDHSINIGPILTPLSLKNKGKVRRRGITYFSSSLTIGSSSLIREEKIGDVERTRTMMTNASWSSEKMGKSTHK